VVKYQDCGLGETGQVIEAAEHGDDHIELTVETETRELEIFHGILASVSAAK
jgi:hypothetical protein